MDMEKVRQIAVFGGLSYDSGAVRNEMVIIDF